MYGLLLDGIQIAITERYGDQVWQDIRNKAGIPHKNFNIHKNYSETVIPRLARAAQELTGASPNDMMNMFGNSFVTFVGQYGYDRILRVLGRNLRDFLNGLDNLHEYLRFSYPKLKPPSFFCENETADGLTLHYRSKRKGFVYYVMGQIKAVGDTFYNTPIEFDLISEDETMDMTHVVMRLKFENTVFNSNSSSEVSGLDNLHIHSDVFFDLFPFHIVFDNAMTIKNIGSGLHAVMPDLVGQDIDEMFLLSKPLIEFNLNNVFMHRNVVFELTSVDVIRKGGDPYADGNTEAGTEYTDVTWQDDDDEDSGKKLRLKGQMMNMPDWNAVIFLATPMMDNLEKMFDTGLYINDLSMHDSSRDLVLAGTQQAAELKLALDQEQQKSKKLEESMKQLDEEMKRTDSLLYQMIPKSVADRLRKGEKTLDTCEVFDQVTILFSDVVGFTRICSQITPMAVVSMLNTVYTKFDKLSEKHRVYKVETIGDAYMVVSGAPNVTKFHALYISDMAFDMMDAMRSLLDPSTGKHIEIRLGIHSGTVVAGVVGLKMPRYCLFGDTVNVACRLESGGQAMKIHISDSTKNHLEGYPYKIEERGQLQLKNNKRIKTYWLVKKIGTGPSVNVEDTSALDIPEDQSAFSPLSPSPIMSTTGFR